MVHLKLIQGRSYTTLDGAISATRQKPDVYVKDEAAAREAVASGFFVEVAEESGSAAESAEAPEETPVVEAEQEGKTLDEMNKSELETFATYRDVDIKGCKTKAEIIEKLRAELPAKDLDGIIKYGSPTMVELQKEKGNGRRKGK